MTSRYRPTSHKQKYQDEEPGINLSLSLHDKSGSISSTSDNYYDSDMEDVQDDTTREELIQVRLNNFMRYRASLIFPFQLLKKTRADAKISQHEAQRTTKTIKTKEDDAIKQFARKCTLTCSPFLNKEVLGCSLEPLPDSLEEYYETQESSNLALLHEIHDMLPNHLVTLLKKGDADFVQKASILSGYVPKLLLNIFPI